MTIIDRVTITGADDTISPADLLPLTADFPFVEWGLLFSPSSQGARRYPSLTWVAQLAELWPGAPTCAAHLCGRYVQDAFVGALLRSWGSDVTDDVRTKLFGRVQLNAGARRVGYTPGFTPALRPPGVSIILQCNLNTREWAERWAKTSNAFVPLFDESGGDGAIPAEWPAAWPEVYCGYAGGLSPDTLPEQLPRIAAAAPGGRIWIDMESGVRTDDAFDLVKVRAVLEYMAPYVANGIEEV